MKIKQDNLEVQQLSELKSMAIKGGGANIISEMILLTVRITGLIILSRLLNPRDFGLVTMVTVFYLLVRNFGVNGFSEFIIQKKVIKHIEISNIFWLHALLSILLTISFIATAPVFAIFYKEPELRTIATIISFGIIGQMLSTCHLAILKRKMEFVKVAVNRVIAGVLSLAIALVMALKGFGYWAVVTRQLSDVILLGIGAWIICSWRPSFPGKFRNVVGTLKYVVQVYGNFALDYVMRNLDKILLGRLYGSGTLGNYERAYNLSAMPAGQLVTPLNNVGLATLSRLRANTNRYVKYYTRALSALAFIGVLGSVIFTITGRDLVFVVLGSGWEQAGYIVTAFGPGIGVKIIYMTHSWIHLSLAKPGRWLRWSIISSVLFACFLSVSAIFGPTVVAGAYSISYYVLLFPALWYAGRPIELKIVPLGKSIGPYFVSGLCTFLIWLVVAKLYRTTSFFLDELKPVLRLCIVISLSSIVYTALVIVFHRSFSPLKELVNIVKILIFRDRSNQS